MTVDLTTFNGVIRAADPPIDPTSTDAATYHFEAHQRGEKNYLPAMPPPPASRRSEPLEAGTGQQEHAHACRPGTVGWTGGGAAPTRQPLLQPTAQSDPGIFEPALWHAVHVARAGDPQYPFPWLNWSYRPFNNEYELLLVPAVSSSRLLARSTTSIPGATSVTWTATCVRQPTRRQLSTADRL